MDLKVRKAVWFYASFIVLGSSLVFFLGFVYRNYSIGRLAGSPNPTPRGKDGPLVGSTIDILAGQDITGTAVSVDLSHREKGTLLLVLSPHCPFCRINFQNWREILTTVPKDEVVWVDVTDTADQMYLVTVGISSDAKLIKLTSSTAAARQLLVTPTTVLLDQHGKVRLSATGVLHGDDVAQFKKLAAVRR